MRGIIKSRAIKAVLAVVVATVGTIGVGGSAYGLSADTAVFGLNNSGQLGLGDSVNRSTPTALAGGDWVQMRAGDHTLALAADGSLWSWGRNSNGELGRTGAGNVPGQIGSATDWASIDAILGQSFAIKTDGTLWGWGRNSFGQLGLGDLVDRSTPTQVGTDTNWQIVATGGFSALAIKTDGTMWSWGSNTEGELGHGDLVDRSTPTQVGTDTNWATIAANAGHALATRSAGTLWAWGGNGQQQLGLGDVANRSTPTQVGTDTDWASVEAGDNASLALKTDGTLWGFGSSTVGQLGLGVGGLVGTPTRVGTDQWDWVQLNAHALARRSDGTLWVWGFNSQGQLGLGDTTTRLAPVQLDVGGEPRVAAAGEQHSVVTYETALPPPPPSPSGFLAGCGENAFGEIGDDTSVQRSEMVPVGTDNTWVQLSAGDNSSYGLRADGTLWAWGWNGFGQLGVGDTVARDVPTQIGTDTDWAAVAAGAQSAYALKTNGTLWSWGDNGYGELGLGDNNLVPPRTVPTQIGSDTDWRRVDAGQFAAAAIKDDGTLWTWGFALYGQLGLGVGPNKWVPTQVGTASTWERVSSGRLHMLATRTDGSLWSWGNNQYGQLGLDDTTTRTTPTMVAASGYAQVSAGWAASFTLTPSGELWSFGSGPLGQGGVSVPHSLALADVGPWDAVDAGGYGAMGLRADGSLWSWGSDGFSELCQPGDQTYYGAPTRVGVATDWLTAAAGFTHTLATKSTAVGVSNEPPQIGVPSSPIVISEGANASITATATDSDGSIASIAWTPPEFVTVADALTTEVPGVDDDVIDLILTVCDDEGGCSTENVTVVVTNVEPTVDAGNNLRGPVGTAAPLAATFTDPGVADTHSATTDWGDGSAVEVFPSVTAAVNATHVYTATGVYTVTVCVLDDDGGVGCDTTRRTLVALAGISVDPLTITEGDPGDPATMANITIRLSQSWPTSVTVKLATAAGTAKPGLDYFPVAPSTVTIPAGATSVSFPIAIANDALPEADEQFDVKLSNAVGAVIIQPSATVTILDEDPPSYVSIAPLSIVEGDPGDPATVLDVVVTMDPPSAQSITVKVATASQTARVGADYRAVTPASLVFPAGSTEQTYTIVIVNDALVEGAETFRVVLKSINGGAEPLGSSMSTMTIIDNDRSVSLEPIGPVAEGDPVQVVATLSAPTDHDVTVQFATQAGTAKAGKDYVSSIPATAVIPEGQTSVTVSFPTIDDLWIELTETVLVTMPGATGAVRGVTSQTAQILSTDTLCDEPASIIGNTITGTAGNDTLCGTTANEVFVPLGGVDLVLGNGGNDTVSYATAPAGVEVRLWSGIGWAADRGHATGWGTDELIGISNIIGSRSKDLLWGNSGANTIVGGAGDDTVVTGGGTDSLDGGTGVDTVSVGDSSVGATVNLNGGSLFALGYGSASLTSFENVFGSDFDDTITGTDGKNEIYGNGGGDTIFGRAGDDRIFGFEGIDIINGGIGNDNLHGGDGDDTIFGDVGNDIIQGNANNDTLWGQNGNDEIFGGAGADEIHGGNGIDDVYGEEGDNDQVFGDPGNDTHVSGGPGVGDVVNGGPGIDVCSEGETYLMCP